MSTSVVDNTERARYEVHENGELAGFLTYRREPGQLRLDHAEIEPAFRGRGLAETLAVKALADARAGAAAVLPYCPFVARFISRNPEYLDLVPADRRAEFDLPD